MKQFSSESPLRCEIPNQPRRNCAICGPLLQHLSLAQRVVKRLRCRPDPHLSIPSVPATLRSYPAWPETAVASHGSRPAAARYTSRALPAGAKSNLRCSISFAPESSPNAARTTIPISMTVFPCLRCSDLWGQEKAGQLLRQGRVHLRSHHRTPRSAGRDYLQPFCSILNAREPWPREIP